MKILITGGTGFIGSALCLYLIEQCDHQVVNIDKLTYAANPASLTAIQDHARYQFVHADIADRKTVTAVLDNEQPDAIIHLAAESHVDRSIDHADSFIQTNVLGTFSLLEAARIYWSKLKGTRKQEFRVLNVSTDEVYGSLGSNGLFSETTAYDPSSPYAASKAASDHLAMAWFRTYGLPVIISNCANNYGPRQFPEKLIPLMIIKALAHKTLPVYGDGSNIRDWLHVDDHARALLTIVQRGKPGEKYNVGTRTEKTNLQVVRQICQYLDKKHPAASPRTDLISSVEDRPGHDQRYAIDPSRIETELGWKAQENFSTGLEKTIDWYLNNKSWWQPLIDNHDNIARQGLTQQGTPT